MSIDNNNWLLVMRSCLCMVDIDASVEHLLRVRCQLHRKT